MKKKIKDLTIEEIKRVCKKQTSCESCPLAIFNVVICVQTLLYTEVEIDE